MNAPVRSAELSDQQLKRIAAMIHADAGINLTAEKRPLVQSRLAKRLRGLGLSDFGAYCDMVESPEGAAERAEMLSALTTNVTRFFREEHHFEELRDELLPQLAARARQGEEIRIWSAGCSSGEEPYSIALTVHEAFAADAGRVAVKILATDIDPYVLHRARAGLYPKEALAPAPAKLVERHFETVTENGAPKLRAGESLRRMITFNPLNLMAEWPIRRPFDAIFCRNVIIYFDAATQEKLITRFAALLRPGGRLFLGHSERTPASLNHLFDRSRLTSYRRL